MSSIISLDHEIVQLLDTVGMLWVYQTSQRNWVAIKVHYRYLESICWVGTNQDWYLSLYMTERYLWAHSVMHHHNELNEIKRGIGIPTIESRGSNVPIDKENCIWD